MAGVGIGIDVAAEGIVLVGVGTTEMVLAGVGKDLVVGAGVMMAITSCLDKAVDEFSCIFS